MSDKWTQDSPANIQLIKLIRSDIVHKSMTPKEIILKAKVGEQDFKVFEAYSHNVIKSHLKACRGYVKSNTEKGKSGGGGGENSRIIQKNCFPPLNFIEVCFMTLGGNKQSKKGPAF